jgi:transcriptional antiterminator RfaH
MLKWYLITYNLHAFQLVTSRLRVLGADFFAPTKEKVSKRADCQGHRVTQTLLFPGYLFVRLDPEIVHPTLVGDISGVREFVKFGGDICTISNSLIEAWRQGLMIKPNKNVTKIEMRNVSASVLAALQNVVSLDCKLARQAALFDLLQAQVELPERGSAQRSLIVTVLETPYIDEMLH